MHSSYYAFQKPDPVMEASIDVLLNRMTLEEKIDLLGGAKGDSGEAGNTVSCARVGIPSFRMADATMGVHWWIQDTTTYPATIALAASFDTALAARYAEAVARDCRAGGIHILLGPGLNLYRSPLCGRNFEYLGEDPALTAQLTVAYVRALQAQGVAATLKHYAVNYQEFDRNKVSSDVDERTLREIYLAAFEAGVKHGGAAAVMTGYNRVNGLHCAENGPLLRILKDEWGFDGVVMSDWVSVYSALNTAEAGLDLEMPWAVWMNREHLVPAVREGRLSPRVIDDKVRRLLRMAKAFDWIGREQKIDDPDRNLKNAAVALDVARQSIVLLKNDGLLPLPDSLRRLAVIGPNSDPAVVCGGGSGYNPGWRTVSLLAGLRNTVGPGTEVVHARGLDPQIAFDAFEQSVFQTPGGKGGVEVEYFNANDLSGAPVLVRVEERINHVWKDQPIAEGVEKKAFSFRATARMEVPRTGSVDFYLHLWDGAVRLLVDGKPVFDCWDREAFGDHWIPVELRAGVHQVVLEFRNIRGWNSCCLGWDLQGRKGAEYRAALDAAAGADAVVFCGGFNHRSEAEGADRTFAMPADTEKLLLEVLDRNPRVAVVLTAGGNVDMEAWHDRAAAVVHAWFPGQEGGTAVAEILLGLVNPSGRLPATFERRLEDRSSHGCYHDDDGDLRVELTDGVFGGYRHFDRTGTAPRYPFGFGLSYTSYAYENLVLSRESLPAGEAVTVKFDLVNTGSRPGADAPQVYVSPPRCRVPRPVKELKAFTKVFLGAGDRRRVTLDLGPRDFAWYNADTARWETDPGTYTIHVGASSADLRLAASLEITGCHHG